MPRSGAQGPREIDVHTGCLNGIVRRAGVNFSNHLYPNPPQNCIPGVSGVRYFP